MVQALDTLEDFLKGVYGAAAYERIDGATHSAQRHAAVQRFNAPDSPAWSAVLFIRSCPPPPLVRLECCIAVSGF